MNSNDRQRSRSGRRVLIVGTGGQGVLTMARLLCDACVEFGHDVVSGQLHGMAQRGGAVQSSVVIDCGISPVIGTGRANCVVGLEPAETVRALPAMSAHTLVYMNTTPVIPYVVGQRSVSNSQGAEYPELKVLSRAIEAVTSNLLTLDATRLAAEAGSSRALNMIMLGCLLGSGLLPFAVDDFWNAVASRIPPGLREANTRAFHAGVECSGVSRLTGCTP